MHLDPIWTLVLILAATLPIQLPTCCLGKQWRMDQGLGTLHCMGDPKEALVSWLQMD